MHLRSPALTSLVLSLSSLAAACGPLPEGGDLELEAHAAAFTRAELPGRAVVEHFFPDRIWFSVAETCASPATASGTGKALYSVRTHPGNRNAALVSYSLLFRRDCGAFDGHPGDIESFYMTLRRDSTCSIGWRLHAIKTLAHTGSNFLEVNEDTPDSCGGSPNLYASMGKHALYLSTTQCAARGDVCDRGFAPRFALHDAGISSSPLVDDLAPLGFAGERVWTATDEKFCGGMGGSRSDCPGQARNHLTRTSNLPDADLRALVVQNKAGAVIRARVTVDGDTGGWKDITAPFDRTWRFQDDQRVKVEVEILVSEYLVDGFEWRHVVTDWLDNAKKTHIEVSGTVWGWDHDIDRSSTIVGPVSAQAACEAEYGPAAVARTMIPAGIEGSAGSWYCWVDGAFAGVDIEAQCRRQYEAPELFASHASSKLPNTLYCYRP
jgi:hypothetical protein